MVCRPVAAQDRGMKLTALLAIFSAISLANPGPAAGEKAAPEADGSESLGIALLVYDFAKLSESEQNSVRKDLTQLMQPVGIRLDWIDCGRGAELVREERCGHAKLGDLFLRIVTGQPVEGSRLDSGYLGLAEQGWGGRGRLTVMVRSVRDAASGTHWQFSELLAHAIAHEIGHLLGLLEHSEYGVMRADWRKGVIHRMTHAALVFSASEGERMREEVRFRTAGQVARVR